MASKMGVRAEEIRFFAIGGGGGNTHNDEDANAAPQPWMNPQMLPRDVTLTTGEGRLNISIRDAKHYRYWVKVEHGRFSQRHNRRRAIENWLEDCKIDFECDLERYYFTNKADVTMLMLKWS